MCAGVGDEVALAGGLLHTYCVEGSRVALVALSSRPAPSLVDIGFQVRSDGLPEAFGASSRVLGLSRAELLHMPDHPLPPTVRIDLQAKLATFIREERPDIVLTHGPGLETSAVDRRNVAGLVEAAITAAGSELFGRQSTTSPAPSHEVAERWFFAPNLRSTSRARRTGNDVPLGEPWEARVITFDATVLLPLKLRALASYFLDPEVAVPARVQRLLAAERFIASRRSRSLPIPVRSSATAGVN